MPHTTRPLQTLSEKYRERCYSDWYSCTLRELEDGHSPADLRPLERARQAVAPLDARGSYLEAEAYHAIIGDAQWDAILAAASVTFTVQGWGAGS